MSIDDLGKCSWRMHSLRSMMTMTLQERQDITITQTFTVSTSVDENGNEIVTGVW